MSGSLEEVGTVVAAEGDWLLVDVARRGGCGGCASNASCGVGTLATLFGRRPVRLRVRNAVAARPGDRVSLAIDEGAVASGAAAVYAVPLVGLILGAAAGQWLAARAGLPADLGALGLGMAGLWAGLGIGRRRGMGDASEARYSPVVRRRLPD